MLFRLSRDADILVLTGEAERSLIKKQSALACYQSGAPVGRCHPGRGIRRWLTLEDSYVITGFEEYVLAH